MFICYLFYGDLIIEIRVNEVMSFETLLSAHGVFYMLFVPFFLDISWL